ncbi:MAG: 16S rRNA (cytosine(967)-C(5))-methyltransferase RsmB [Eubacteriales bacterium]|nr:16S rRNA (cytosine(967)-C(5))-methyltransferase RsmB [Eubacteriales bacterium]MDQ7788880.1 16S rRNA (cytosine(967)-C(5))-methyltransferase RsmB [Clostridia bacterium]MDZ4043335.1 16S rRNA (cytosine(967)-C(5))-methyltransferase RsmB [Eubacteriales bacterium]MDZ7611036.1 16S rRNA (cytosine(967)-C(5))-methyltransferase RsmB [Eubacteriales bacterium]
MSKIPAREIALHILKAVEADGAYANLALNRTLEQHQPEKQDRAFATELAYGTLRTLNTLDWIISRFLQKPLGAQSVWVRNILRTGVYQIFYMDRVPPAAACNEAVELTKKFGTPGAVGFVNGVLRNIVRKKDELVFPSPETDLVSHISLRYSHPTWMVERWLREFSVEETVAICKANNNTPPNSIRTNTLRISPEELKVLLEQEGLSARPSRLAPEGLEIKGFLSLRMLQSFRDGLFQIQDESSMLVAHAVNPAPRTRVIDACSAPGGKTTHLAQVMDNEGSVRAFDLHPHKLDLVRENCSRLGITCVETMILDARELPGDMAGWADYVLVDTPCSGLGVLRRRPDARWRKEPGQIAGLVKLQDEILQSAAGCVRPGGILVYSTCTITREENQDRVEYFLFRNPDFVLEDLSPFLPAVLEDTGLSRGYIQLMPHVHQMDGFFIARMRKRHM